MKYYVAMFATLGLVVAATFGAYQVWDNATHTRDDSPGLEGGGQPSTVPAEGQVLVAGHVDAAHLEGVVLAPLAMPLTITTSDRGVGGATITPVEVKGKKTSIDWQAGQPLPLSGDGGSIVASGVVVDATADGITVGLDGVRPLTPGEYTAATSVAIGTSFADRVTFTASDSTTISFRGGAHTAFPGTELIVDGTGNVSLQGALRETRPDGSTKSVPSIDLSQGTYHITLTPAPEGGYNVQATLQGAVN